MDHILIVSKLTRDNFFSYLFRLPVCFAVSVLI